jgi:hypothetical protein
VVEPVHDRGQPGRELVSVYVGCGQQSNPAGDVEPDATGRDHATGVDVRGRNAPDRKPIAPVHVRHRIRRSDDPWQRCPIGDLLQRLVAGRVRQQLS